jgi:hypothetical protein
MDVPFFTRSDLQTLFTLASVRWWACVGVAQRLITENTH